MTKLSFKERERQRREREILRTAARLIRERGYANLNMDDIADEVGVSKPTLYQHFKSKDDMVAYTLLEACDTMEHYINESEGGSALERLEKILRHMLAGYLDPDHFSPTLMQASGMGPLQPNTILMGASEQPGHREEYCRTIAAFHDARRNVVVLDYDRERGFGDRRRIDVWWGGLQKNGGLMMLLAYLLRTSREWRRARVCVKLIVPDPEAAEAAGSNLRSIIEGLRIGAEAEVLVGPRSRFPEMLRNTSADADLVFLGLAAPEQVDDFTAYYERLQNITAGLPSTAFVLAAEDLDFAEVLL